MRTERQGFIGMPLARKEDARLLCGQGCYTADVFLAGEAHAVFVRTPHAHARIRGIDAAAARAMPGVLAVLSAADAAADGLRPLPLRPISVNPHEVPLQGLAMPPYPPLAEGEVRFVGQALALVVAETLAAAKDAAERVAVDYEPLPLATSNCVDCETGDRAAVDAAFGAAAHVVKLATRLNRVTGVPMEPRAALAHWEGGRVTVYATSAFVQKHRDDMAAILGVPESAVRVVTRDLGGNYGPRNNLYPEYPLVAWAARRLGRPVKWTCERSEAFLTDEHSRDLVSESELALAADGRFLALRGRNVSNVGAFAVSLIPLAKGIGVSTGTYAIAAAAHRAIGSLSYTCPTSSYRAAGRPEVMYILERLIDIAARRHGFDRISLREKNLPRAFPHRNPYGLVYDSGDYLGVQEKALRLADWKGFATRRREARARGRLRGIGIGNYVELNTGAPRERAEIAVRPDGGIDLVLGTLSSGQGHETAFAQLLADWLHVPIEKITLKTGDTDIATVGGGTHSGRSLRMGASVIHQACGKIIEEGKARAAERLEAAAADIEFARGRFVVKGTDRAVRLAELAPLSGLHDETTPLPSFAYGTAVCEVEVDPETGVVEVVRHCNVDDCGRAVNPLILHGQAHGGMAAGIGQALWEHCRYDEEGQLLSASFMDYAIPRAGDLPFFRTEISEVASTTHPLGMRGGGEGGTTPALAAVANAICDALDVEHVELPATPERVWRLIAERARASR
jgi:carbon-monoxide dehydrogenase large subunit